MSLAAEKVLNYLKERGYDEISLAISLINVGEVAYLTDSHRQEKAQYLLAKEGE